MQAELLALEQLYQNAVIDLLETIDKKSFNGGFALYEKAVLDQLTGLLGQLSKDSVKWVEENIPAQYQNGITDATGALGEVLDKIQTLTQLDKKAIRTIVKNTSADLVEANEFVGRRVKDVFRQVGLEETGNALATGQGSRGARGAKVRILERLRQEGITHFVDKAGRKTNIQSYANMVGRSTIREARNRGQLNTLTQNGYDLVQIVVNFTSCPICSKYEGRVYSISGNDKRYPKLFGTAFGANANIHPNCRHVIVPFIEILKSSEEIKESQRVSNLPFDVDKRSEAQRKAYEEAQTIKRQARETRGQFERYRNVLGADAPKTLSGFSKAKGDDEKWQALQSRYKARRREILET
jgi:hypothetical protein